MGKRKQDKISKEVHESQSKTRKEKRRKEERAILANMPPIRSSIVG